MRARASTPFFTNHTNIARSQKKIAQEGTPQRAHFGRKSDDDFSPLGG
jgi:hypothetical protein